MPSLSEAVSANTSNYQAVDNPSITLSTASPSGDAGPGQSVFMRTTIPPVWQPSSDSQRTFFNNAVVPQTRLMNPPTPQQVAQTVNNVTNNTTQVTNTVAATASQSAGLIASTGSSGQRQFYQTANPDTTPPTSAFTYRNGSGKPLLVAVSADGGGGGFHGTVYCNAGTVLSTIVSRFSRVNDGSSNPNYYPGAVFFVVPAGFSYGISVTSGGAPPVGTNALDSWTEWTIG